MSQGGVQFPYNLNPWAREYLNNNHGLLDLSEEEIAMIEREMDREKWSW